MGWLKDLNPFKSFCCGVQAQRQRAARRWHRITQDPTTEHPSARAQKMAEVYIEQTPAVPHMSTLAGDVFLEWTFNKSGKSLILCLHAEDHMWDTLNFSGTFIEPVSLDKVKEIIAEYS